MPHAVTARAEDAFQPRAAAIDMAAAETGARSLLINSPNNPTGVVYAPETLDGIAEVCRQRDLWLISDEVYDTQVWEGDAPLAPRPARHGRAHAGGRFDVEIPRHDRLAHRLGRRAARGHRAT